MGPLSALDSRGRCLLRGREVVKELALGRVLPRLAKSICPYVEGPSLWAEVNQTSQNLNKV